MAAHPNRFVKLPVDRATNIEQYLFVQIGDDTSFRDALRLHTGISNPLLGKYQGAWDNFVGTGGLLAITSISESSRQSAESFRIVLRFPPDGETLGITDAKYDLYRDQMIALFHAVDIADLPVCIWLLEINVNEGNIGEPRPIMVGQISTPNVTPESITVVCYSAGTLLDKPWNTAILWNDYHQNNLNPAIRDSGGNFVNEKDEFGVVKHDANGNHIPKMEDGAFKFASRTAAELGVEFP